jgi:hypothetical protein
MSRLPPLLCCCAALAAFCGCGPMQMPMPVRLDEDGQKSVDQSWDRALTPVDLLDHQAMLDVFLISQAYQAGVDRLSFRSEKKVAAGTVVMQIEYDRLRPDEDRFEVRLYDPAERLLRQEVYRRKEIEDTYKNLFVRFEELRRKANNGQATPAEALELAELRARRDAIERLFPDSKERAAGGNEKKP